MARSLSWTTPSSTRRGQRSLLADICSRGLENPQRDTCSHGRSVLACSTRFIGAKVHRNGVPWHPLHRRQRGIPMKIGVKFEHWQPARNRCTFDYTRCPLARDPEDHEGASERVRSEHVRRTQSRAVLPGWAAPGHAPAPRAPTPRPRDGRARPRRRRRAGSRGSLPWGVGTRHYWPF